MDQLSEIKRQVDGMSHADLSELRNYIGMRLTLPSKTAARAKEEDFTTHMLDALVSVASSRGADVRTRHMLERSNQFKMFDMKCAALKSYFDKAAPTTVQRRALMRLAMDLVFDDIALMHYVEDEKTHRMKRVSRNNPIAVSCTTVMAQVHRIPSLINKELPGYAAAGKLSFAVRPDKKRK